ncbi:myb-like protein X [Vanessa atalanta]|uniref:myb-like protein X n=1 Tax=Vanessa atalanta TaxID=42275 RepID=UPI001FCCD338|nr:myb-like protein X [Vanessa atalanta]
MLRVYFSTLVKLLSGYLLFAANFEDFHTIAKKLAADKRPVVSTRNNQASPDSYYEYEDDYERSYENRPKNNHQLNKKRQKATSDTDTDPQIDFEELVERVKKRIEKELKDKYLKNIKQDDENKGDIDDNNEMVTNKENNSETLKHEKENKQKKSKVTEGVEETSPPEDDTEFIDEITDKPQRLNSNKTHTQEKIIMTKKDSYEDYKMPEKETDIYSSSEKARQKYENTNKRFKIEQNRQQKRHSNDSSESTSRQTRASTKRLKSHGKINSRTRKTTPNYDYKEKTNSDELETKTKKFDVVDETTLTSKEITKRAKSGTMLPTRERYKTVTPNYNAKLPTLVEKYDFDEPLPERDREREDLKYYGNPPARINKKIRLV